MQINCKESAIRSSELRDRRIKGMRKLELWYHLLICKFCRTYDKQIRMLGRLSRLMGRACDSRAAEMPDAKLSEDAKSRIKENLKAG